MGAAQVGRHEVRVVEVGQRGFGVRQTVISGENLPLVGKLLGHRRHRSTVGYAHVGDDRLLKVAEKIIEDAMKDTKVDSGR